METLLLILRLLAAALLYGFLAAVFVLLWRDLKNTGEDQQATRPSGRLVLLDETEQGQATAFQLLPVTSIGRAPNNTVPIADSYASGQHALLSWRESQWWLEDLSSRNGTLLNEERIVAPSVVASGDIIQIGRVHLKVELEYGPGPEAQSRVGDSIEPGTGQRPGDAPGT
jgi:pSer/pThr/pTyr-binding forkhead associated (FHA) protein